MSKKRAKSSGGFGFICLVGLAAVGVAGAKGVGGSPGDAGGIPSGYLAAYRAAGDECAALDWQLLAAIGWQETRHGRNGGVSSAGAEGPMQFMPATWAAYGSGSPYDIDDAAEAAARYLCAAGLDDGDSDAAIYAYNHSWSYVAEVQAKADEYR